MDKLFKNFVGIDISKTWFDAVLIKADDSSSVIHEQFSQKPDGFLKIFVPARFSKHDLKA